MRHTILCLLALGFLGCGGEKKSRTYVRIPIDKITPEFIQDTDFIRDSKRDDVWAFGYVKNAEGLTVLDESILKHHDFDAKTLEIKDDPIGASSYEGYHNYQALTAELKKLSADNPNEVMLETAGKSGQGRELWFVRISKNILARAEKPKFLLIANMHGDETVGRECMIYLARQLLKEADLLANAEIVIMPSMNPDGFEADQRWNANGDDLNRSFPDFTSDPNDSPSGRPPEVQAIMKMQESEHFQLELNFHGGAVVFNLPWDTQANSGSQKFAEDALIHDLGRKYADTNPSMLNGGFDSGLTYGYEWYEVDGGMQDWSIYYRGSVHATVELSNTKHPSASQLPQYWSENQTALLGFLRQGLMGLHLKVVDGNGNAVEGVFLTVSNRKLYYPVSFINRPTGQQPQDVTVEAEGFKANKIKLNPETYSGTYREVALERQ